MRERRTSALRRSHQAILSQDSSWLTDGAFVWGSNPRLFIRPGIFTSVRSPARKVFMITGRRFRAGGFGEFFIVGAKSRAWGRLRPASWQTHVRLARRWKRRCCFVPIRFCVSRGNIFGGQHSELMEAYNMRSNKWNLITALLYVTAGICFIFAAIFQTETPSKVLYSIAAVCFLIGGIGFSCTYVKKRKRNAK